MTTITVINAVSSLLAAVGIGGFFARENHRARKAVVEPVYVTQGPVARVRADELPA
jgi:hypothetical protein